MEIPPEGTRRLADGDEPARILLPEYVRQIDAFNASRPNAALRGQVRQLTTIA
jgi:hypothetical protein